MSHAPSPAAALVRVTVTGGSRRVDLVLPGEVPVAELVPGLARSVGLLDALTAYGGYRLLTQDGRRLTTGAGLTVQGVADRDVLFVAAGVDDEPLLVYDDVVEAMADLIERELRPRDPVAGRRAVLGAAALLLLVGAGSLLAQHGSGIAAAAAVVVGVTLVLGAIAVSRTQRGAEAAVTVAVIGCAFAAVAGLMLAWGRPFLTTPVAAAGGAMLAAGVLAALGLAERRTLLLPPVVIGAVLLVTGLATQRPGVDPVGTLTTIQALVVMAEIAFWSVGTSDTVGHDEPHVAADARLADEILVAMSATVGLLLVVAAPLAVSLGPAATLVSVEACLVVMLRSLHHAASTAVPIRLYSGAVGLVATTVSILWLQPGWRPATAVALAVTGAVLLAFTCLPKAESARRRRLAPVALLGLVPALLLATGLVTSIRG